ncbi:MAG: calcineurin-like phosphoesterase C-terminal domain-containing protein [Flavisolibacter sp.]
MQGKQRYFFLFFFVLLLEGNWMICQAQASGDSYYVVLKGRVTQPDGRPIAGVPVTDGIHIVQTDKNGAYLIESTTEAMFVYITVPSGYQIPTNNNMALFYKRVYPSKGTFRADFTLRKLTQDDTHHFTILWADPQINNKEEADLLDSTVVPDTHAFVQTLMKKGPVQGIAAGDLSWDAPPIIPEYKKAIQKVGIPFFQVLGNHDMDVDVRSDEQSDSTFRKSMGPTWYSFNRGRAHYIVLDNVFYFSKGYNYIGYVTERQLKWLEQDLKLVRPGSLVIISMHIPVYTEEKRRTGADDDNPGDVTHNRKFLYQLLKPYQAHFLTGHTHYNENREEDGMFEHIGAAVCATWWVAPLCVDGTPRGYGVYEVNGDSLRWYYKSSGYAPSYQMRVYNRGRYKNRPSDIAVNVWNWDRRWKVEWYQDGVLKGNMRQQLDFDADVVSLLTGPSKPTKYPWAQPLRTDHLFFATPDAQAKKISIKATDRFGTVYTEELTLQ